MTCLEWNVSNKKVSIAMRAFSTLISRSDLGLRYGVFLSFESIQHIRALGILKALVTLLGLFVPNIHEQLWCLISSKLICVPQNCPSHREWLPTKTGQGCLVDFTAPCHKPLWWVAHEDMKFQVEPRFANACWCCSDAKIAKFCWRSPFSVTQNHTIIVVRHILQRSG